MPLKKQIFLFVFSTFLGLAFINKSNAISPINFVEINKKGVSYRIEYLKDNNFVANTLVDNLDFKKIPQSYNLGKVSGIYWFKINISHSKKLVSYIPTHNINKIDIFTYVDDKLKYLSTTGNSVSKENLLVNYKFPSFDINPNINNYSTYLLKVNFPKEVNFPIQIIEADKFLIHTMYQKTINSLFYGTSFIVLIISFLLFIKFKHIRFFYYFLFLLSVTFNFLLYDGSLIDMFRGNNIYYNLDFLLHLSELTWLILYSVLFLNLKNTNKTVVYIIYSLPIISSLFYLSFYFTKNFTIACYGDIFTLFCFLFLFIIGLHNYKKVRFIKLYLLNYLIIFPIGFYFFMGYNFGLWPVNGDLIIIKIFGLLSLLIFTYGVIHMLITDFKGNKPLNKINFKNEKLLTQDYSFLYLLNDNNIINEKLTLREIEILKYLYEGYNNTQISEKLFISKNTVKYHVKNIYSKTKVNNRNALKDLISSVTI